MGTKHSEITKLKMKKSQHRPEVIAKKSEALRKYWNDVKAGRKPFPKRGGGPKPKSVEERFWSKVNKNGPSIRGMSNCWVFESNHGGGNYGMLGRKEGDILAHRLSWELHNGPIPLGLKVLHKCDNTRCVNPDHLFLGTLQDNMNDMVSKGRSRKGEKHPSAKLNGSQVSRIRLMYDTGKYSQQKLAVKYGVNQTLISAIVRKSIWKHV